ncbi:MAG: ATP-binding cassette domain-containing protein [Gammaproteobacteria bacterium]
MGNTPLLQLEKLGRRYGERWAVEGLDLTLHAGEVVGFLGPNGAGKSTTMRMISGNLAPSEGRIAINGIDLLDDPGEAKRHLGYLPETPPLYRELTVDEYLRYCARLHRLPRSGVTAAIEETKGRCGLETVGGRLIGNLSKGYQQRVGIAQAIIHQPAVVILDEPTVGLDPRQIREIRNLIGELGRHHGVLISTHLLPEVLQVCTRVEIIHQGRRVYSESVETLTHRQRCDSTRVAFRRPPGEAVLRRFPGVRAVESLGGQRFRLHHHDHPSPADAIVRSAVENDWGLVELTPERAGLEQIFIELTAGEGSDPAPPGGSA